MAIAFKNMWSAVVLLHLIDVSSDDILSKFTNNCNELEGYSPELCEKPEVIVLSKIDLFDKEELKEKLVEFKKKFFEKLTKIAKVFTISQQIRV